MQTRDHLQMDLTVAVVTAALTPVLYGGVCVVNHSFQFLKYRVLFFSL